MHMSSHVVQGTPIVSSIASVATPVTNEEEALNAMATLGFPRGLSKELLTSTKEFPVRFWVVDNSGSMNMNDGTRLVTTGGTLQSVKSSRWNELCDTLVSIAQMAATLGARTDFHLLNRTTHGQHFSIADAGITPMRQVGEVLDVGSFKRRVAAISPSGGTPLTEAVMQIVSLVEPAESKLRASGQRAVVVLATDGMPNDKRSFLEALRALQRLPVWLVVRLCTDDESVIEYWNELDQQL